MKGPDSKQLGECSHLVLVELASATRYAIRLGNADDYFRGGRLAEDVSSA